MSMITVENKLLCLVYGPPTPFAVLPPKFHPGKNEISSRVWDFCCAHTTFKRDFVDTEKVVGPEPRDHKAELRKLKSLKDIDPDVIPRILELVGNDTELVKTWLGGETRPAIVKLLRDLLPSE